MHNYEIHFFMIEPYQNKTNYEQMHSKLKWDVSCSYDKIELCNKALLLLMLRLSLLYSNRKSTKYNKKWALKNEDISYGPKGV